MRSIKISAIKVVLMVAAIFPSLVTAEGTAPRPAPTSLTHATTSPKAVDTEGFIRRWLVLEPIPIAGNLTEKGVKEALLAQSFPDQLSIKPADGDSVMVKDTKLTWHALDTLFYNVNLYHFAWSLSRPTSNVLFWAVTVVDAPQEMTNVRLAIGSNAASNWWLNDEPVIEIYGDRQTVIDDGVSKRITLHQGHNVVRVAVINGGGATDFCARFLDTSDMPITSLKSSLAWW
jgi:hypothetical protein